jgi:hypothetical protein
VSTNAERLDQATKLIKKAWPGLLGLHVVGAVLETDAAGALAYHLDQAQQDNQDPVALLRSVSRSDLAWAIENADDPAAFLARRVADAR